MSDSENEIFELPKKEPKKKKGMSEERRQQLLENLKKGRETSKKNRAKNKQAKEIIKRKKNTFIDDTIREEVLRQEKEKKSYKDLENELNELKKKLMNQTIKEEPSNVTVSEINKHSRLDKSSKKARPPTIQEKNKIENHNEYILGKHYSNNDLVTKKNTDIETNFSTFKSMWD